MLPQRERRCARSGPSGRARPRSSSATELFRRILAHPEGVEIARQRARDAISTTTSASPTSRSASRPSRCSPEHPARARDGARRATRHSRSCWPRGLRTRWTANTIQRDPAWRKGTRPALRAQPLARRRRRRLGVSEGDARPRLHDAAAPSRCRRRSTRSCMAGPRLDAERLRHDGLARTAWLDGATRTSSPTSADRDPFTGIPHHRYVRCRVERA